MSRIISEIVTIEGRTTEVQQDEYRGIQTATASYTQCRLLNWNSFQNMLARALATAKPGLRGVTLLLTRQGAKPYNGYRSNEEQRLHPNSSRARSSSSSSNLRANGDKLTEHRDYANYS
ncbi:unnamed protein product [Onchocerca ochengi]|uniref:IMS_C domain-containing protein n=1 Tax=Onchocerca ochengi TaxID=42157 RepID=A0A182EAF3_ONCOC|nr:unnamed protein product [Onchocerca ochengi]